MTGNIALVTTYEYLSLTLVITSNKGEIEGDRPTNAAFKKTLRYTSTFYVFGPQATDKADEEHDGSTVGAHELLNRFGREGWRLVTHTPWSIALFSSEDFYFDVSQPVSEVWRLIREVRP